MFVAKNKKPEGGDDFAKFSRAVSEAVTSVEEETKETAGSGVGDVSVGPEGVGTRKDEDAVESAVESAGGVPVVPTPPQEEPGVRGTTGKLLSETPWGGREYPPPKVREGVSPLLVEAHKTLRQLLSIFPPAEVIIPGVGDLVARLRREIEGGG